MGASRVTQTAGLVEERAAGKMLYGLSAPWPRASRTCLRGREQEHGEHEHHHRGRAGCSR